MLDPSTARPLGAATADQEVGPFWTISLGVGPLLHPLLDDIGKAFLDLGSTPCSTCALPQRPAPDAPVPPSADFSGRQNTNMRSQTGHMLAIACGYIVSRTLGTGTVDDTTWPTTVGPECPTSSISPSPSSVQLSLSTTRDRRGEEGMNWLRAGHGCCPKRNPDEGTVHHMWASSKPRDSTI